MLVLSLALNAYLLAVTVHYVQRKDSLLLLLPAATGGAWLIASGTWQTFVAAIAGPTP